MPMTWTYTGPVDDTGKVRLAIGDTDSTDKQLYDEEIAYQLTLGSVQSAAASCARLIAAKYARQMNKAVGPFRIEAAARYDHYMGLAAELESQMATAGVAAFAGGISIADKAAREDDSDRVPPAFTRALFDNTSDDAGVDESA